MPNYESINNSYIKYKEGNILINSEKDAIIFIENAYILRKALIFQSNLAPDFFDLSTRLAGEVLQKLVNYGIKTAFVVDKESIKSEYFKQLMNEAETLDGYRFFDSEENAVKWLLS